VGDTFTLDGLSDTFGRMLVRQVRDRGLEQWNPRMKGEFPLPDGASYRVY